MTGLVLQAGAWPTVTGLSGVAVVVGGCGAAFPARGAAHWCFADLLAVLCQLSTQVPALRQVI
jgi:hypothetical protein